jgi:lipopolysaccharide export system permease protein
MLLYMVYSNLLSVFQSWVAQERIPAWLGWTGVHAVMLALLAWLFWRRLAVAPLWRRRRA